MIIGVDVLQRFKSFISMALISLMLLSSSAVYGQKSYFVFNHINKQHGLDNKWIIKVIQGPQGFIWIASQNGLFRFDGYQVKIFVNDPQDSSSLPDNYVQALYVDNQEQLWVGMTQGGIARYQPQSESFINYRHNPNDANSLSHDRVRDITEDDQGHLWIATQNGLNRFDPEQQQFERYYHDAQDANSITSNNLFKVLVDSQGGIWIGTRDKGVTYFDPQTKQFKRYLHQPNNPQSLTNNKIYTLAETIDGKIWIGTRGGGLNSLDPATGVFEHYRHDPNDPQSLGSDHVYALLVDDHHALWVGSRFGGLNRFIPTTGHFDRYVHELQNDRSLSDSDVFSIAQDSSGLIWLATFGGGVSYFDPASAKFGLVQHDPNNPNSMASNEVKAIIEDHQGKVWIGTDKGLDSYDPELDLYSQYRHNPNDPASLINSEILTMHEDSEGGIWLGSKRGVSHLNPATEVFTHYRHVAGDKNSLIDDEINAISSDSQGYIWVGSGGGLDRLDPRSGIFKHYQFDQNDPQSISSNYIRSLFFAADQTLWVGTSKGLNQFNPQTQKFKRYLHHPDDITSLSHNAVYNINQDLDGTVWVGTRGGLNRLNLEQQNFTRFTTKDGLVNNRVQATVVDDSGKLWIAERGLSVLDIKTQVITTDIGRMANCQGVSYGAFFKAPDGKLYFGGEFGYCSFYPSQVLVTTPAPEIVFTDFKLLNKSVPISTDAQPSILRSAINHTQALTLTHLDNVLSFEFAALGFHAPEKNLYQYRLTGFNRDWIETTTDNRRATFTNLSAGKYKFELRASNYQGIWNEAGRVIELKVLPAPWRTWWAYTLYLLFTLFVVGLISYQFISKQRLNNKRNKQLSLALWGSGDQLWDWNKKNQLLHNRNILSHFEYATKQALASPFDLVQWLHPEDQQKLTEQLQAHIKGELDHIELAYRLKDKNGQWRWVFNRGKIVSLDQQGQIRRIIGTLQDIHDSWLNQEALRELNETLEQKVQSRTKALQDSLDQLKAAQQQLVEAEKMAALGNLVAGVAHEVNTPLGNCITMVSMHIENLAQLNQRFDKGTMTRKTLAEYLQDSQQSQALVANNLHRAAELIQSFKKVAVEQTEDNLVSMEFHQYLKDIITSTQPRLKGQHICIKLLSQGDWEVKTWPGAWWQILSNLIENSLSHGFNLRDSGEISIDAQYDGQQLRLIYQDNGNGMTGEQLARIYEPFFTTSRKRGGIGLGMHVVFNLVVQKLAGTIKCDSQPEHGVKFVIKVPVYSDLAHQNGRRE